MTHTQEIMRAVAILVRHDDSTHFTRRQIRKQLGIDQETWMASYTAIFQSMRVDHPGGAPEVAVKFRGVFQRIAHGTYTLTLYGKQLLQEFTP